MLSDDGFFLRFNSLLDGFVLTPTLTHTSCAKAHVHQCLDVTGPAVPTPDGSHVHHSESWVLYEHGHSHYYKSVSGPALSLPNGWHVHDWNFYTTVDAGHRHHVSGPDMPAQEI